MRFPLLIAVLALSAPRVSGTTTRTQPSDQTTRSAITTPKTSAEATRSRSMAATRSRSTAAKSQTDTLPAGPSLISAFHFIDSAFNKPSLEFDMLGPGMPPGLDSILFRFNNAIADNRQWFTEYKNQHPGQTLPYNIKFGITEEEYRRIQDYASTPTQMVPVDSQQVSVIKIDGLIRFKCSGEVHFLDYLYFNPQKMEAYYGGDTIPFVGPVTVSSSPYGPWQGFKWRLEQTNIPRTFENVTAHVVEIDLGLPPKDDKLFIRIFYQDLKSDKTTSGVQLAGFLH